MSRVTSAYRNSIAIELQFAVRPSTTPLHTPNVPGKRKAGFLIDNALLVHTPLGQVDFTVAGSTSRL
jgi:hypothetical protein